MTYFLGQIKPENAKQFQDLQPGKWGVYLEESENYDKRWFISPISPEPFNHYVLLDYKWLEEDYGITILIMIPHNELLEEVLETVPDEWKFVNQYDQEIVFKGDGYRNFLRKEIENPTIKDNFV